MENTCKSLRFFRMPKRQSESSVHTKPFDERNEIVGQSTCNYSVTTSEVKMAAEIGSDVQDLEEDDHLPRNTAIEAVEISKTEQLLLTLVQWQAGNSGEKVDLLIGVWNTLTAESRLLPHVTKVFDTVFRHTIQTVLSEEWQTLGTLRKQNMARALTLCSQALGSLVDHAPRMCATLLMAVYDPWGEPILRVIAGEDGISDQNVQQFLASEPPELVLARIQSLVKTGNNDAAFHLCQFYLRLTSTHGDSTLLSYDRDATTPVGGGGGGSGEEEHRQRILPFIEWLVRLLHNKNKLREIVTETANCTCHEGVQLIRRIRDDNSEDSIGLAETLTHLFLVRDLLYPSMYCCTKELMMMWCSLQVLQSRPLEEVYISAKKLVVLHASTSAHFYLFVDVLWDEFGQQLFPLYLEMYVRGLTADLNHLEVAKQEGSTATILEMENHIASIYTKLGSLFSPGQEVFARECVLSAFSVEPTPERMHLLQYLTFTIAVNKGLLCGQHLATDTAPGGVTNPPEESLAAEAPERKEDVERMMEDILASVVASQDGSEVSLRGTEAEKWDVKPAIEGLMSFQNAYLLSLQQSNRQSLSKPLEDDLVNEIGTTRDPMIPREDSAQLKAVDLSVNVQGCELNSLQGEEGQYLPEKQQLQAIDLSVNSEGCELNGTQVEEGAFFPEMHEPKEVDSHRDLQDVEKNCVEDSVVTDANVNSLPENGLNVLESEGLAISLVQDHLKESRAVREMETSQEKEDTPVQDGLENEKEPPKDVDTVLEKEELGNVDVGRKLLLEKETPNNIDMEVKVLVEKEPKNVDSESKGLHVVTESAAPQKDDILKDLETEIGPSNAGKDIPLVEGEGRDYLSEMQKQKCNCGGRCNTPDPQQAPADKSVADNYVFFHPLLDAPIEGIHLDLIKDLVIVLESTRHNMLQCCDDWEEMRIQCQEYMETMAALRLMLQHNLCYDSADSETDSASDEECFPVHRRHPAQRISRQNSCDSPFDDSDLDQMSGESQGFDCDKVKTTKKHACAGARQKPNPLRNSCNSPSVAFDDSDLEQMSLESQGFVCDKAKFVEKYACGAAKQKSKLHQYFNEHSMARDSKKRRKKKKRKSKKEKDRDLTVRRVLFDGGQDDDGRNLKKKRKRPLKKGKEKLHSGIDINTVDLSSIVKANARILLSRLEDTESNLNTQLLARLEESSVHSLKPIEEIQSHLQSSNLLSSPRDCPLVNSEPPLQMPSKPLPKKATLNAKATKLKASQKSKLKAKHQHHSLLKKNSKRHRRLKLKNRLKKKARKRVHVSVQTDTVDLFRSNYFAPIPHTLLHSSNGPPRSLIDEFGRPILASATEPTAISLPAPPSDDNEAVRTSCAVSFCTNTPPIQSSAPSNRMRKTFPTNQTVPSMGKTKKIYIKGEQLSSKMESFSGGISPTKMSIIIPTTSSSTVTQTVVVKVVKTPAQSEVLPSVDPVILQGPKTVHQPVTCTINGNPQMFTLKTIAGSSVLTPSVNLQQTITVPVTNTIQPQAQNFQNMSALTIPISTGIHNANGKLVAHKFLIPVRNLNNLELMPMNSNRLPLLAPSNQSTIPNVIIVRPQSGTATVTLPDKATANKKRIWTQSRDKNKQPVYEWRKIGQKKSTNSAVPAQRAVAKSSGGRSCSTPPNNFSITVVDQTNRPSVNGSQRNCPTPSSDPSATPLRNNNMSFASGSSSANQNSPVGKTMQSVQQSSPSLGEIVKRRVSTSDLISLDADNVVTSVPLRPLSEPVDSNGHESNVEQSRPNGSVSSKQHSSAHNVTSSPKLRETLDSSISDAVRFSLMFADDGSEGIETQVGIPNYNTYQEPEGYLQPESTSSFTEPENVVDSTTLFGAESTSFETPSVSAFPETSRRSQTWKKNAKPCKSHHASKKKESEVSKTTKAAVMALLEEIKKKKKHSESSKREKDGSTSPGALARCHCETCGRGFVSTYNLKRHYKNVHKVDISSPKSPRDGLNFNLSSPEIPFSPASDTPISPPCASNLEAPQFLAKTPPQLPVSPKQVRLDPPQFGHHLTPKKVQYSWQQATSLPCSEDYPNTYSIPEFYTDDLPPVIQKPIVQPLLPSSENATSQSMQSVLCPTETQISGCFVSESNDDVPFPPQQANVHSVELLEEKATVNDRTSGMCFTAGTTCNPARSESQPWNYVKRDRTKIKTYSSRAAMRDDNLIPFSVNCNREVEPRSASQSTSAIISDSIVPQTNCQNERDVLVCENAKETYEQTQVLTVGDSIPSELNEQLQELNESPNERQVNSNANHLNEEMLALNESSPEFQGNSHLHEFSELTQVSNKSSTECRVDSNPIELNEQTPVLNESPTERRVHSNLHQLTQVLNKSSTECRVDSNPHEVIKRTSVLNESLTDYQVDSNPNQLNEQMQLFNESATEYPVDSNPDRLNEEMKALNESPTDCQVDSNPLELNEQLKVINERPTEFRVDSNLHELNEQEPVLNESATDCRLGLNPNQLSEQMQVLNESATVCRVDSIPSQLDEQVQALNESPTEHLVHSNLHELNELVQVLKKSPTQCLLESNPSELNVHVDERPTSCRVDSSARELSEQMQALSESPIQCRVDSNLNELGDVEPSNENSFQKVSKEFVDERIWGNADGSACNDTNGTEALRDTSGISGDTESLLECRTERDEKLSDNLVKVEDAPRNTDSPYLCESKDSPVIPENVTMGRTRSRDGKHHPKRFCPCCEEEAPLTKKCRKNSGSSVGSTSCAKTLKGHSSRQSAKPKKSGRKAAKMPTRSSQKLRTRSSIP